MGIKQALNRDQPGIQPRLIPWYSPVVPRLFPGWSEWIQYQYATGCFELSLNFAPFHQM